MNTPFSCRNFQNSFSQRRIALIKHQCFHILHGSPVVATELHRRPTNYYGGYIYNSIQRCGRSGREGGWERRGIKLLVMEFLRRYVRDIMAKFREGDDILMGRETHVCLRLVSRCRRRARWHFTDGAPALIERSRNEMLERDARDDSSQIINDVSHLVRKNDRRFASDYYLIIWWLKSSETILIVSAVINDNKIFFFLLFLARGKIRMKWLSY